MANELRESKQRILSAAARVFARKSYAAAGVREIAQEAGVNISMISYYFGGKEGVLKEIVNQTFARYEEMLKQCIDENKSIEENIRCVAHGLIRFFRERTEEAIVAFDIMPLTIPETIDLMAQWKLELLQLMGRVFGKAGFGLHDQASYALVAGTMPTLVLTLFQGIYVMEATGKLKELTGRYNLKFDDAYFEDYADKLADFMVGGINALKSRQDKPKPAELRSEEAQP